MMAWIRSLALMRNFVLTSIFFPSALAINGNAQTFRATILGTLTDTSGAAIPGATVSVKNTGTGLLRTVITDDDGKASAPSSWLGISARVRLFGGELICAFWAKCRNGNLHSEMALSMGISLRPENRPA
jgi:hypothetical protein